MASRPTGLRRILLVDDPSGATVTTGAGTRPALPGEWHEFATLAEALARHTGMPADVQTAFTGATEPGTAIVIPSTLLDRMLVPELRDALRRTAVVGVPREAIEPMLALQDLAAVVEYHQYGAWKRGEPADAAVYGDLAVAPLLGRDIVLTPLAGGRFGRIRIDGGDLPGLLGDYLSVQI